MSGHARSLPGVKRFFVGWGGMLFVCMGNKQQVYGLQTPSIFPAPRQRRHLHIVHGHQAADSLKTHPYKLFDTPRN